MSLSVHGDISAGSGEDDMGDFGNDYSVCHTEDWTSGMDKSRGSSRIIRVFALSASAVCFLLCSSYSR